MSTNVVPNASLFVISHTCVFAKPILDLSNQVPSTGTTTVHHSVSMGVGEEQTPPESAPSRDWEHTTDVEHAISYKLDKLYPHFDPNEDNEDNEDAGLEHSYSAGVSLMAADEEDPWARKTVLCLEGGGIRGYSSLLILRDLMKRIVKIEEAKTPAARTSFDSPLMAATEAKSGMFEANSNSSSRRSDFLPCHYFDYVAGTSTGGLNAIMLGRLRMSVDAALDWYRRPEAHIFGKKRHAGFTNIRGVLRNNSRNDMFVSKIHDLQPVYSSPHERDELFESDESRCRTIVCSMEQSTKKATKSVSTPFLFRSYRFPGNAASSVERNPDVTTSFNISDVVQATLTSSHHLKSFTHNDHKYFDAGLGLNNPSWEIYNEVVLTHHNLSDPISFFLSLGCGYTKSEQFAARPTSRIWRTRQPHSKLEKELSSVCMDVHEQMLRESSHSSFFQYFRLDVQDKLGEVKPYDWKSGESAQSTLDRIRIATEAYLSEPDVQDKINACASELVLRRRQRAETILWESFALGTRYRCTHADVCDHQLSGAAPFQSRNELLDHLRMDHKMPPPDVNNYESFKMLFEQGRTYSDPVTSGRGR
jgi:hypothetical protein